MKQTRDIVSQRMREVHLISAELATYHVAHMEEAELQRRLCMYTGMELSADATKLVRATSFYPAVTTRDDDGTSALNSASVIETERSLPDSEAISRVQSPP